jgi:hypothetical protein
MKPSSRRAAAMTILAVFIVFVALGLWQLNGDDTPERDGEQATSVAFGDLAIGVPEGWSVVRLTQDNPCPPVRATNTVVVSDEGLGGDCRAGDPDDARIWVSAVSPLETTPPATIAIGNTTGWVREQPGAAGWVAVVPGSKMQITFSDSVKEATRNSVIDSITKR